MNGETFLTGTSMRFSAPICKGWNAGDGDCRQRWCATPPNTLTASPTNSSTRGNWSVRAAVSSGLGRSYLRYEELLLDRNLADFAHLQRWAVEVIYDDHEVGDEISAGITHLLLR